MVAFGIIITSLGYAVFKYGWDLASRNPKPFGD